MEKELAETLVIRSKMVVPRYAREIGNVQEACREFGDPRSSFYRWKSGYERGGREVDSQEPIARSDPKRIPPEYIEKILHLRREYHLGPRHWIFDHHHRWRESETDGQRTAAAV